MNQRELLASYKKSLIELKEKIKLDLTDEVFLTYILKSEGNVENAYERFCQGPWTEIVYSGKKQSEDFTRPTHTNDSCKSSRLANSLTSNRRNLTQKFTSLEPFQNTSFFLGSRILDLTSSCHITNTDIDQSFERDAILSINFFLTPQRTVMRKTKLSVKTKGGTGSSAFPYRGQSTDTAKENISNQITLHLAEPLRFPIQIGHLLPVTLTVYLSADSLNTYSSNRTTHHSGQVQECWTQLFFTLLQLKPNRPSMLYSINLSSSDQREIALDCPDSVEKTNTENTRCNADIPVHNPDAVNSGLKCSLNLDEESVDPSLDNDEDNEQFLENSEEANAKTNEIFNNVADTSTKCRESLDSFLHPAIFRSVLRPYQQEGLMWMREHELSDGLLEERSSKSLTKETEMSDYMLHPMWDEFVIPQPSQNGVNQSLTFYFSRTTGVLTDVFPVNVPQSLGGILADEMGLGKTVQTIALIACELRPSDEEINSYRLAKQSSKEPIDEATAEFKAYLVFRRQQYSAIKRHLVLPNLNTLKSQSAMACLQDSETFTGVRTQLMGGTLLILPLSLMSQWKRELLTHLTPGSRPKDPLTLASVDIVLTTYGMVAHEFIRLRNARISPRQLPSTETEHDKVFHSPLWLIHWRRIVLDEAHIIKCPTANVSQAVCTLLSRFRWCLTGTPIQNSVEDVFALLRFLRVDPWGSWSWWFKVIVQKIQAHHIQEAVCAVRRILHPLILRRTKQTCDHNGKPILSLASKTERTIRLTLTPEEKAFYNAVHQRVTTELDAIIQSESVTRQTTHVLELLLRLRQSACHPLLIYSSSFTRVASSLDNISDILTRYLKATGKTTNTNFVRLQVEKLRTCTSHDMECPICREFPEDPAMGPCCHIMCRTCALMGLSGVPSGSTWPCPVCRIPLTKQSLRALPGAQRIPQTLLDCLFNELKEFQYSSKLRALRDFLLQDISASQNVVVFSQWTSFLDIVQVMFRHLQLDFRRFDGDLTLQQRDEILVWFHNNSFSKNGKILLASLRAGGVGLNLTAATRCYILDPWWNPAVECQAIQRIHRFGQTKEVHVFRLIAEKTVEERILALQQAKSFHATAALAVDYSEKSFPSPHNSKLKLNELLELFKEFNC